MGFKKYLKKIFKKIFKKEKPVIERIFSVYIHKIHIDEHSVILSGSLCGALSGNSHNNTKNNTNNNCKYMFDRLYYTTQIQELIMTSLELQIPIRILCYLNAEYEHIKYEHLKYINLKFKKIWQIKYIQTGAINEWISVETNSKLF